VAGQERMGDYHLRNLVGFPLDTTLAAAQLIFTGVLDRFPRLRICLGQAGGFFPYIIGRLDAGYHARPECRRNIKRPPSDHLRHFYYDSIIHSAHSSAFLIDTVGADRVMFGTDFPSGVTLSLCQDRGDDAQHRLVLGHPRSATPRFVPWHEMLRRNPVGKERYVVILVDDQCQKTRAMHPFDRRRRIHFSDFARLWSQYPAKLARLLFQIPQ
jgi:hypothetical protein